MTLPMPGYLFEDTRWGTVSARFERTDSAPPDALINNVNVVPFVREIDGSIRWLAVRLADGSLEVPGGTREAGEPVRETMRRELVEEAGAELVSFTMFGAWRCTSNAPAPYRPHLAHPSFFRVVGWGEVKLTGAPSNPADGEQVVAVETGTIVAVAAAFAAAGRPDLAELYRLAAALQAEAEGGR